ncbi:MAG: hypothetical protein HY652_06165 [Acidobacteria bacterium]|nr:hypothetical protein [Acidobacteriota bacterium]
MLKQIPTPTPETHGHKLQLVGNVLIHCNERESSQTKGPSEKTAQVNDVYVDRDGLIWTDRFTGGLYILEFTGQAKKR